MAKYRIRGRIGGGATATIDQEIIVDSDELAIAMAKNYPLALGEGLANWARLTDEQGRILWEVGDT